MLTERRDNILKSLIQEYISTAMPVSSEMIARRYELGVSPATIRNEMAQLEEEGYTIQPHTSAGRIPSAKGYRYYVEILLEEQELSPDEQRLIRHQFSQMGKEIEEWIHLTATILSRMLRSVAIVTWPRLVEPRLKLVELVSLREFLALLILILKESKFKQQVLAFDEAIPQEDLSAISRKLTSLYAGLTGSEIRAREDELSPSEERVAQALIEIMDEGAEWEEPYLDGLSQILSQPEFTRSERAQRLMELIEERSLLRSILSQAPGDERLRVIIGGENPDSVMHDFSVVMSQYGLPGQASGVVGVMGPTRMPYQRAFPAVRFLSGTLSELLYELYR